MQQRTRRIGPPACRPCCRGGLGRRSTCRSRLRSRIPAHLGPAFLLCRALLRLKGLRSSCKDNLCRSGMSQAVCMCLLEGHGACRADRGNLTHLPLRSEGFLSSCRADLQSAAMPDQTLKDGRMRQTAIECGMQSTSRQQSSPAAGTGDRPTLRSARRCLPPPRVPAQYRQLVQRPRTKGSLPHQHQQSCDPHVQLLVQPK